MSHGLHVLPAQENPPTRFFDVVLRSNAHGVRLRIQRDNLYLIAYRNEDHHNQEPGRWREFRNGGNAQLVPHSDFLPFTGSYDSLTQAAGQRRDGIALGRVQLSHAVSTLAQFEDRENIARSLIVIIQMVCESMRFTEICETIASHYDRSIVPGERILELENSWGALSGAVLHHDDNPEGTARLRVAPHVLGIEYIPQAVAVLGILLRRHAASGPRLPRAVDIQVAVRQCLILPGRSLVEVFNMRIVNIDNEDPGQLYGVVTATDGLQRYSVYRRSRENYQSVRPGQYATLTGPSRAISAADDFTIDFNLMDRDTLFPDDEVAHTRITWNVYDHTNTYNELQRALISGHYGFVSLDYVVMSNAAEALVEIVLIDGDGERTADVYGDIYAQTSSFSNRRIELFRRESHENVGIGRNDFIPLLRPALAVPMDASLFICVSLWDHDLVSRDDEIAHGTAQFIPDILQSSSALITGQYGKVEVRVSWI
ncbi:hypothetical protein AbraIFM66951_003391 [Aspergillus brasiliensis]|uniref:rRNA N-glycosylase n=1 Tax=Aspergillus brasiliensis TaxID=319629 RepID=A0A9W5YMT4_9EURO|nr:hypothetical protein AbraCBS73388_001435 [Aspergillus brasiliensis]GKZ43028.1 hypothetical protein AbraIFM66951_003391 [Aspergillus brasiliensis]